MKPKKKWKSEREEKKARSLTAAAVIFTRDRGHKLLFFVRGIQSDFETVFNANEHTQCQFRSAYHFRGGFLMWRNARPLTEKAVLDAAPY